MKRFFSIDNNKIITTETLCNETKLRRHRKDLAKTFNLPLCLCASVVHSFFLDYRRVFGFLLLTLLFYTHAQEDVIRAAMRAQLESPQLRTVINMELDGEPSMTTIDYVAPDRFRLTQPDTDMIIIGDKTYQNEGNGWEILEMNMAVIITQFRNSNLIASVVLSNVQTLSNETLGGKTCNVYRYTQDFEGIISQDKLWIEKSTGLPLRLESEGEILNTHSKSVSHYEYTGLEITVPIQ